MCRAIRLHGPTGQHQRKYKTKHNLFLFRQILHSNHYTAYCLAAKPKSTHPRATPGTPPTAAAIVSGGTNEGWHQIWFGLRGLPATGQQTWSWYRVKLDRTPPLLVITSPSSSTVMQPMIEVQGFEPSAQNSQAIEGQSLGEAQHPGNTQIRAQILDNDRRDLAHVVNAWAGLPAAFKAAILAIVNSTHRSGEVS
jgi:hypothetical protein